MFVFFFNSKVGETLRQVISRDVVHALTLKAFTVRLGRALSSLM